MCEDRLWVDLLPVSMPQATLPPQQSDAFLARLPENIALVLRAQHEFTDKVSECQLKAFHAPGKRDAKQREMDKLLAQIDRERPAGLTAPSPVNPNVVLTGVEPKCKMFQSALYPAAVSADFLVRSFVRSRVRSLVLLFLLS